MPYRTADNVIDGLVITIVDINRSKQAELQAQASSQLFEGIVQTVREPLVVLDADLRVVQANDAFYHTFATQAKQTEGVLVYELGNRQWNIPELRTLLEKVLPERAMLTDFRVEHEFPRIGRCAFLLNARRLSRGAGMPDLILLAFEDVTGRS
jgi:two-component system CheB/CheR fusion protein